MKELYIRLIKVFAILIIVSSASASDNKPNILLISIDDLRPTLGCYGNEHVVSPNIDKLSSQGITFDRCYVQVAVCNPSRASFLTGLRPNTLGCWTLRYHFRETKPDAITLPQYLRQHGYTAEGIGKIFHNPWQDPRSWSSKHFWEKEKFHHYTDEQKEFTKKVRESLPEDSRLRKRLRGALTNNPDIKDEEHIDGAHANLAIERLKEFKKSNKPFFLATGFILPHVAWCPPKKYWDLYDKNKLPLALNPDPPKDAPAIALGTNYEWRIYSDTRDLPHPTEGKVSEEKARHYLHGYYASISFIDQQVGKILDALKQEGLAENTIVVLWSDHGYKLGEHNGWGKMTNYEIDTRIPFIIYDPRAKANGKRVKGLIETLDIFPTLCELAGIPKPTFTEGKSAAHLLDNPEANHIDAAFSQYIWSSLIGNAIRTDQWRYVEWCDLKTGEIKHRELYDHRTNSLETENVVANNIELADQLQKQLHKTLPAKPINVTPKIRSFKGGEKIAITLNNQHPGTIKVSWIDETGRRAKTYNIQKGKSLDLNPLTGSVYSIESLDGKYHEIITIAGEKNIINLGNTKV